ncbi:MAG: ATP-grasp domain-containing protein [Ilumatobacteraceae bacterium]
MILLWGVAGDAPFDDVRDALSSLGADVHVHDQRLNGACDVQLSYAPDRGRLRGTLTYDGSSQPALSLDEVRAVYVRPYSTQEVCRASSAAPGSPTYERAMRSDLALLTWADLSDAVVVNRPAAMAANGSKPFQLALIATHGFAVPDTLITTDADEVRRFWAQHGRVIYKSVSGLRSIVSQLGATHLERLDDVASGPTQFQQYVPGVDVRVHVIGSSTFATEAISDADDYRYASRQDADVELEPYPLPVDVADRCVSMVRGMGLTVGGVDLRRTADDQWYCFEVNPSPAFSYYERNTGQPIAMAIAEQLHGADRGHCLAHSECLTSGRTYGR